jgi:hypothetical protein
MRRSDLDRAAVFFVLEKNPKQPMLIRSLYGLLGLEYSSVDPGFNLF